MDNCAARGKVGRVERRAATVGATVRAGAFICTVPGASRTILLALAWFEGGGPPCSLPGMSSAPEMAQATGRPASDNDGCIVPGPGPAGGPGTLRESSPRPGLYGNGYGILVSLYHGVDPPTPCL